MSDMIFNIVKENNVIGKGSFGKIYYYPKSFPNYVVKKMKKYNIYENDFILNNLRELWWYSLISKYDLDINYSSFDYNNLTNINFSNIPKMLNYNIDSEYIYLAIEYRGSSIYSMLNEIIKDTNSFNSDKYIELLKLIPLIIYSCSKILMQLHYANIRHGDITFSNVMYNERETNIHKKISIIDWGSIVFSRVVLNNYNQCSPNFMAPELKYYNNDNSNNDYNNYYNNYEIPSIKSDIYSLGILILYILDPNKYFLKKLEKYLNDSDIIENQYEILDTIIENIIDNYKHVNIEKYIDKRVFYLLKKMLDTNVCLRLDIDSLYMDELFTKYRNEENNQFDKYFLKNILRKRELSVTDIFKNLLIEQTHNYLKFFRTRIINNLRNSKYYKLIDTRIILLPVLQLFYSYLNKMNNDNNISTLNLANSKENINHYIVSFLCCIKWIDIIYNDDITIFNLYDYYTHLYNLLHKSFPESINLDSINFGKFFDLTFYNIFEKMDGIILTYPYFMDFKYDYLNHSDIKKFLLNCENI